MNIRRRWILSIASIVLLAGAEWAIHHHSQRPPHFVIESVISGRFEHPSDILMLGKQYLVTELYQGRIAVTDDLEKGRITYLPQGKKPPKLAAPHFFAGNGKGFYVSEGWGKAIVRFDDPNGGNWQRIDGTPAFSLHAPHGVCMRDGWIYVADSLNSRLIRFRADNPGKWEKFSDDKAIVSYGRQMLCRDDGIWLANSYEGRKGLNPGQGSNVLRITDFSGGKAEIVQTFPNAHMTGLGVLNSRWLVAGLWLPINRLALIDTRNHTYALIAPPGEGFGPPYGMIYDKLRRRLLVTYLGEIFHHTHKGGIVIYRLE